MLRLRKALLYDFLYILIFALVFSFSFLRIKNYKYQKYSLNNKYKIANYKIKENYIELVLKGKRTKVLARYKISKDEFLKNYSFNDKITFKYERLKIKKKQNKELFNYYDYLKKERIDYLIEIKEIVKVNKNRNPFYIIKDKIYKRMYKSRNSKYMMTFILGLNDINKDQKEIYQKLSINHLFSLSGMHITFLTLILNKIFKTFKINEDKRYLYTSIFLTFYIFLASFIPSLTRASIFFILLSINKVFYFHVKTINVYLLSISIILLFNPFFLYSISFIYSATLSFFLIKFSNYLKDLNYFKSLILVSLIASIVSFPITIYFNFEYNFLAFLNNLFFVPFVCYLFFPVIILNLFLPIDFILSFLIFILESVSKFLINFNITFIFKKSLVFVIIYFLLIFLFIYTKYKKLPVFLYFLVIIIHLNINYFDNNSYLYMIDVNQGDSFLLYDKKKSVLIDTGGSYYSENKIAKNTLIKLFKARGIKKIDHLILTHGDTDHLGEAKYLVNNFKVNNVYFNHNDLNNKEKEIVKVLNKKKIKHKRLDELILDNLYISNLNFSNSKDENKASLFFYVIYNDWKILFTGDAPISIEKEVLNTYVLEKIDILKVGHHGSNTSTSRELLCELEPSIALISAGFKNKFNHPDPKVIDLLKEYNVKIYRTDIDGGKLFYLN